MQAFTKHIGTAVAIDRSNIDTDQIIPKQFLKRTERTGYGKFLFFDWRFGSNGEPIPHFPLNRPNAQDASILIVGNNFGCGSSREHAVWSLMDHGFLAVIAPSFGDIFYNNSLKNGLLPIRQPVGILESLMRDADDGNLTLTIDLASQSIGWPGHDPLEFEIDDNSKKCLLNGFDEIDLTLLHESMITQYEAARSNLLQN